MKVPITLNYDKETVIGQAEIDETFSDDLKKILESGNYTFRAGFEILEQEGRDIKKANLKEISLVLLPEKYGYKPKTTT